MTTHRESVSIFLAFAEKDAHWLEQLETHLSVLQEIGLSDLGLLYRTQGNYEKAEPLWERALTIREDILGPLHQDTATSLNNDE